MEKNKCVICLRDKEEFNELLKGKYEQVFSTEGVCPNCSDLLDGFIKPSDVDWIE